MKSSLPNRAMTVITLVSSMLLYSNCTPMRASNAQLKSTRLFSTAVTSEDTAADHGTAGGGLVNSGTSGGGAIVNDPNRPPQIEPNPPPVISPLPVDTVCTQGSPYSALPTVKGATTLNEVLYDSTGTAVCTVTPSTLKSTLINEHKLEVKDILAQCPALPAGDYTLKLVSQASNKLITDEVSTGSGFPGEFQQLRGLFSTAVTDGEIHAIMNLFYQNLAPYKVTIAPVSGGYKIVTAAANVRGAILLDNNPYYAIDYTTECSVRASPLIIQINPGEATPRPIELSAPLSGVSFDILGENSLPYPHAPKLISWFTARSSAGNYFLALPNSRGEVNGIDELFGNNTRGEDGEFAKNGYEALRKYDGDQDGLITAKDATFARLRLWSDANGDGIAQASELHSLDELGVVSIDLNYESDYAEKDKYGNEIKLKSQVTTRDGLSHVMYDIWFRAIDP